VVMVQLLGFVLSSDQQHSYGKIAILILQTFVDVDKSSKKDLQRASCKVTALPLAKFERLNVQETVLGIQKALPENLDKYQASSFINHGACKLQINRKKLTLLNREVQLQIPVVRISGICNLHTTNEKPAMKSGYVDQSETGYYSGVTVSM